ncbi:MAG: hypothetical protein O2960_19770, partial [Verrucomicrobia bacterium]|nr:hypothetical protein [Verrucomicrobiota bacterium]
RGRGGFRDSATAPVRVSRSAAFQAAAAATLPQALGQSGTCGRAESACLRQGFGGQAAAKMAARRAKPINKS